MREPGALVPGDQLHGDGIDGDWPRRGVSEFIRVRFGEVDHVLPGLEWPGGRRHHTDRVATDLHDPREILERIVADLLQVGHAEHRHDDLGNRVAVRFGRRRHGGRTQSRTATRLVLDDDGLRKVLSGHLGHTAEKQIDADAGLERHDQRDRPAGKVVALRMRCDRRTGATDDQCNQMRKRCAWKKSAHERSPRLLSSSSAATRHNRPAVIRIQCLHNSRGVVANRAQGGATGSGP